MSFQPFASSESQQTPTALQIRALQRIDEAASLYRAGTPDGSPDVPVRRYELDCSFTLFQTSWTFRRSEDASVIIRGTKRHPGCLFVMLTDEAQFATIGAALVDGSPELWRWYPIVHPEMLTATPPALPVIVSAPYVDVTGVSNSMFQDTLLAHATTGNRQSAWTMGPFPIQQPGVYWTLANYREPNNPSRANFLEVLPGSTPNFGDPFSVAWNARLYRRPRGFDIGGLLQIGPLPLP